MIALERDVSFLRASVVGVVRELARLDLRLPVGTPERVLEQLEVVQPVLDVRAVDDDSRLVPLADRLQVSGRGGIQRVRGAGRCEPRLVVGRFGIVEELVFRRAPVDVVVLFGAAIEDSAVAAFGNLPFELELEIVELVLRHEVARRFVVGDRPVGDMPARRDRLGLVAPPTVERFAVEERAPS